MSKQKLCRKIGKEQKFECRSKPFSVLKSDDQLVIAGFAITTAPDRENELITLGAIKKDFPRFMNNVLYRNINLFHTNFQVGIVLDEFKDENGKIWKTEVVENGKKDKSGLFIVGLIRNDIKKAKQISEQINGNILNCFSVGGEALDSKYIYKQGKMVREISELQIFELTITNSPINREANFEILKQRANRKENDLKEFGKEIKDFRISIGYLSNSFVQFNEKIKNL